MHACELVCMHVSTCACAMIVMGACVYGVCM